MMMGFLMLLHTIYDNGMIDVYRKWGRNRCHFPLVWFLKPLSVEWMYLLYIILVIAAVGITIGCLYRCCLIIFNVIFWYIFFLDTTAWTSHYYLFGLVAFLLLIVDGNRYFSIDRLLWPEIRNQEVPLWNYAILRFQIFVMYFVAGTQKLHPDWWYGFCTTHIADHWVFDIFRYFLTNDQINLYVVHRLGCILELLIGFLLFFDKSRKIGLFLIDLFHVMLVFIFETTPIVLFSGISMAWVTIFCHPNWPRVNTKTMLLYVELLRHFLSINDVIEPEPEGTCGKSKSNLSSMPKGGYLRKKDFRPSCYQTAILVFLMFYVSEQMFLPFSFGVFKGVSSEIGGIYSIRWAMMMWWLVAKDHVFIIDKGQYIPISSQIEYKRDTYCYLSNPMQFKQFSDCIAKEISLEDSYGITHITWLTINDRFPQRWYTLEDITRVKWSLFSNANFTLPIMEDYWEMRKIKKERQKNNSEFTDLIFISDFPGYSFNLEISNKADNTTLEVLKGRVIASDLSTRQNIIVEAGQTRLIPKTPRCQFYTVPGSHSYMILTENNWSVRTQLKQKYQRYKQALANRDNGEDSDEVLMTKYVDRSDLAQFTAMINDEMSASQKAGYISDFGLEYGITQLKQMWFLTKQT